MKATFATKSTRWSPPSRNTSEGWDSIHEQEQEGHDRGPGDHGHRLSRKEEDYLSLTDIARYKSDDRTDDLVRNWLRNRNTIEFLGVWERLNNPDFNPVEFDGIRMQAGLNSV